MKNYAINDANTFDTYFKCWEEGHSTFGSSGLRLSIFPSRQFCSWNRSRVAMQEVSPTPVSLLEELHTKFGKQLVEKIREIWTTEALPQADSRLLKYFLSRQESSPQTLKGTEREDSSEEHMFEMVCKMVLYHPDVWYEVVSGM